MQSKALVFLVLLGMTALAVDRDFVLPLKLTNAHISAVFFGCRTNATDGFDRNFDEPGPPPGMQTGYVGFIGALQNSLMRKDIRAHGEMKEWKLSVRPYDGKPFRMAWEKQLLPKYYQLTLVTADKELDMATATHFEITDSQTVAFVAILDADKLAKDTAAEAAAAEAEKLATAETEEPAPAPKVSPEKAETQPATPVADPKRVAGGMTMLIVAMGALLLLIVIFAAVRR